MITARVAAIVAAALVSILLASGCGGDAVDEAPLPVPTASPPSATFPPGIFLALAEPEGGASLWSSGGELPANLRFFGQGFDVRDEFIVIAEERELVVLTARGKERRIPIDGLHAIARPSLSPDGRFVAVQATERPPGEEQPQFLTIYMIDLETGDWRRAAPIMASPSAPTSRRSGWPTDASHTGPPKASAS
ncbi:MAG TPA: hypothetical protein QGI71_11055 [Dehalococcoidia bacterium]|nr:hypothetical protein [Dehalococcoidia bacterium]